MSAALSTVMMHLSRFSEEIIIWNSNEYQFVEIDDAYSTPRPADGQALFHAGLKGNRVIDVGLEFIADPLQLLQGQSVEQGGSTGR